jgi:glutaminyl-peptide cyclotransferase
MWKRKYLIIFLVVFFAAGGFVFWKYSQNQNQETTFNDERAYQDVAYQVNLGPRIPDSAAHQKLIDWATKSFSDSGWKVEIQKAARLGHPIQNIIARRGSGSPWIIIGAHYDSRMVADQDPDPAKRNQAVPAANDGASGVAVLTELARDLPASLNKQVWLVLFDAEDQGDIPGWDWILGSTVVAENLPGRPDAVIVIDMIGDANLDIYKEHSSNPGLTQQIWDEAARLGYGNQIIPQYKYSMLDDHTPFLNKGLPAIDMIDFDYPYWHTTSDTTDKVSAKSLGIIGNTLYQWLITQ